ncbi:GNAT family N-acetyltransferase [Halobacillus karajensis]|uniref:Acetyltransferase n=1 Tax=Halobacillus karajensis TaxID=195088 RepID=A0A024P464_9BACI|nr:GNAT family N-acetyltransferase [Halobacillus karajensis]CDQ18735.1 putative acetyltransferase [Halobacillus karajensis]CDQ23193.1 putative acetyltransferase [Halobacillus karajensis]CDQ26675.1 putative acetyltransferase [Halobacillus karajensis]
MTIIYESDPIKFHEQVEPLLLNREAENNLPLGILQRLKEPKGKEFCHMISFQDNGKTTFMSIRTPPHLWIIPSLDDVQPTQVQAFARFLFEENHQVPGVLGERKAVKSFLKEWGMLTGQQSERQMEQGIFRLTRLTPIQKHQQGQLIEADLSYRLLIEGWLRDYAMETGEAHLSDRAEELAEDLIGDRRLHLWVIDDVPVSMASRARTTKNGVTINAVFTPDRYKKRGYATQAVWHLTEKLLSKGYSFCSLYTDLSNPAANSIYEKIGYEKIGESVVYRFTK